MATKKAAKAAAAEAVAETTEETVTETTEAEETTVEETVKRVYIGPSIPKSTLRNGMILQGTSVEIEQFIGDKTERYPEIKHLLIDPEKLSDAQAKVHTKGNILHKYYQDMAAKAAGSRRG